MGARFRLVPDKAVAICPLCSGEVRNPDMRLYKNFIHCDRGVAALGPVELTMVKALLRGPLSTEELAERVGVTNQYVTQKIYQLRKKLVDIGSIVNVGTAGHNEALYVLREIG